MEHIHDGFHQHDEHGEDGNDHIEVCDTAANVLDCRDIVMGYEDIQL